MFTYANDNGKILTANKWISEIGMNWIPEWNSHVFYLEFQCWVKWSNSGKATEMAGKTQSEGSVKNESIIYYGFDTIAKCKQLQFHRGSALLTYTFYMSFW